MEESTFFSELLGITSPWFVSKVEIERAEQRVHIHVDHFNGVAFPCPKCQRLCSVHDHTSERDFRHLNVCQMATFIHVRFPRIACPEHGVSQIVSGPGEGGSGMTYEFERLALDLEQECSEDYLLALRHALGGRGGL